MDTQGVQKMKYSCIVFNPLKHVLWTVFGMIVLLATTHFQGLAQRVGCTFILAL